MIALRLIAGGIWWVNPDYLIEMADQGDGTTLVIQDHPDGVVTKLVGHTARHIANLIACA